MFENRCRGAIELALMVALVFGAGAMANAQDERASGGGPVIQIGESDAPGTGPQLPSPAEGLDGASQPQPAAQPAGSKYWIGLTGGPIGANHPLRAHLDIPEGLGLIVASVVPDSPAAKAGLKPNDILLLANDIELHEMQQLAQLVSTVGGKEAPVAVDVLRRGQRETVYIRPEPRPADASPAPRGFGGGFGEAFGQEFGIPGGVEIPRNLLRDLGDLPFEFRQLGPGVIVGGGGVASLPDGVSVSIVNERNQPARITVKRGEDTWEIVGDDPASLNQLPEDLRPFVERMLNGRSPQRFGFRGRDDGLLGDGRLRERLERMEQRLQELQERLQGPPTPEVPATEGPQIEGAETQ